MSPADPFQKQIFDLLMESQFWPQDEMEAYQKSQLAQLLRFAHGTVPFYKSRLAPVMQADGDINWDRWQEVPILKRQDLIDHREAMLAPELPPGHGAFADHEGSGTTGKPVTTRHNALTALASQAALWRAYDWHEIDYGKAFCQWHGDDPDIGRTFDEFPDQPWGPAWHKTTPSGKFYQLNRLNSPEDVVNFLVRHQVVYFSGRPRTMQSAALACEAMGLQVKLHAISCFGTASGEQEREDCRRAFGAEIINLYASKEVYNMAHQCPTGPHYHINAELVLLEVLDNNGEPCKPGVRGRCIVTPFLNTAQPLIRYEIGDEVTLGEVCSCGRSLPVLEKIDGRTTHLFRLPDGRRIAPVVPLQFRAAIGASAIQLVQKAPLEIEFRYVSTGKTSHPDFSAVSQMLQRQTMAGMKIRFENLAELPLSASGKLMEFICELPPEP
jgi:phenylacetate-CoA ligase